MSATEAPVALIDRPLSDLSDLEIASLTQALKSNSAQALVSASEPISILQAEYANEGAATFSSKLATLEKDGFRSVRRMRGDGDCFYRAFAFSYVERLLNSPTEAAVASLDKLQQLLPLLEQAGFVSDITQEFYEPLHTLISSFLPTSSSHPTAASLETSFNDDEISNSIVVFLRLLTSAFLKANRNDFEPFMFSLEDDPRFFEGGVPTLEMFCSYHVEAVNKEADHIQITALTRALNIHTRIAYLDQSGSDQVDFHEFEGESEDKLKGVLLYRPGHYDILYQS